MKILRWLTIVSITLFPLVCTSVQFSKVTPEERMERSVFVGLVSVHQGKLIDREMFEYRLKIEDPIKIVKNINIEKLPVRSQCGLSLSEKYLIFITANSETGELVSNCLSGDLHNVPLEYNNDELTLKVKTPDFLKESLPIDWNKYKVTCQRTLTGECMKGYDDYIINYSIVKSALEKMN
jgi:hypothetical protein